MFDPRALQPIEVIFPACGVFVLESHHSRGFRMTPTHHDYLKIVQPFSGAGWLVRGGQREQLRPGDVVLIPPGDRHHIEDDGTRPLALYALCVASTALPSSARTNAGLTAYRYFAHPAWSGEFRGLIRHLLHEQTLGRQGSDLMIPGIAWQALAHLSRATRQSQKTAARKTDQPRRARVAAYAAELARTFYHPLSLDQTAAGLGLSRRHFTQLFRDITGQTWLTMLQSHRLTHARRLLMETDRSIASIGYECGFEDLTTFYRVFKKSEGTSPLAWRNRPRRRSPSSA